MSPQRVPGALAIGLLTAAIVVVADQATKRIVVLLLPRGEFVPWLSDRVGWQLVYNDGGAFSLPAPSLFFLAITVVVTVVVVRGLPRVGSAGQAVAYGLLLAGALGNALDRVLRAGDPGDPRFLHGHVIDFVAWGWWPRFNLADSAITCGVLVLVVVLWRDDRRARADADAGTAGRRRLRDGVVAPSHDG